MASSLRMADIVSQLWPLLCSQATSRRRRVSDGNPRVRCTWRWAEFTRSCFRSAAAAGFQHAKVPGCICAFDALQHSVDSARKAWRLLGCLLRLLIEAAAVCNNDAWQHSLPMLHAAFWTVSIRVPSRCQLLSASLKAQMHSHTRCMHVHAQGWSLTVSAHSFLVAIFRSVVMVDVQLLHVRAKSLAHGHIYVVAAHTPPHKLLHTRSAHSA